MEQSVIIVHDEVGFKYNYQHVTEEGMSIPYHKQWYTWSWKRAPMTALNVLLTVSFEGGNS